MAKAIDSITFLKGSQADVEQPLILREAQETIWVMEESTRLIQAQECLKSEGSTERAVELEPEVGEVS